jgi:hypothetical protein
MGRNCSIRPGKQAVRQLGTQSGGDVLGDRERGISVQQGREGIEWEA